MNTSLLRDGFLLVSCRAIAWRSLIVIQLDNGRLHTRSELEVHNNIILLFQPSYSPQVNPIERLWKEIKKQQFSAFASFVPPSRARAISLIAFFVAELIVADIFGFHISPDGKILVSGGSDRTINIWQLFP